MARSPVIGRQSYYARINRNVPGVKLLDFNVVQVNVGDGNGPVNMIEPRPITYLDGKVFDQDLRELAPDSLTQLEEADFAALWPMTNGHQLMEDFSL